MISDFIENPGVVSLAGRAEKIRNSGKRFSDIEDEKGFQYVDLVQEGGGVLGIALVGYTYMLEKAGIRFFSLAGTSAGAINTLLIAALAEIGENVSEKIILELSKKELFDFVDGKPYVRNLLKKALRKQGGIGWTIAWNVFKIYFTLKHKYGLNPGENFENWLSDILRKEGINTTEDLNQLRSRLPKGIKNINDPGDKDFVPGLALISSDITTHTKAVFPQMNLLYWQHPEKIPPSRYVRASMSIPFFFEPMVVGNVPRSGKVKDPHWDRYAKYFGPIPKEVKFVDGGMLSNFPINVFHRKDNKSPRKPSFGVRLSTYRADYSNTSTLFGFSGAMINTMRQIYDYDFLLNNPDYRKLICRINADKKFNWLNFNMTRQEQVKLFHFGALKAVEFLEDFDWENYKSIRKSMATKSVNKSYH